MIRHDTSLLWYKVEIEKFYQVRSNLVDCMLTIQNVAYLKRQFASTWSASRNFNTWLCLVPNCWLLPDSCIFLSPINFLHFVLSLLYFSANPVSVTIINRIIFFFFKSIVHQSSRLFPNMKFNWHLLCSYLKICIALASVQYISVLVSSGFLKV